MREISRDLTGAGGLFFCIGVANEDEVAAGSSGNTLGIKGSADHNAVDETVPPSGGSARADYRQGVEEWVGDIVRGLHVGTVDESHDDVVNAGLHLNRNLRETLHNLRASLGPLAMKRPVLRSADRLAEYNLAIDHDYQRALILKRGGVYSDSEVVDGDAILAVGGEVVFETDA